MKYNPDIHHRRSIRLKGYDYSQTGLYFITVCTQDRLCLFGKIEHGEMLTNDAGKMIKIVWEEISSYYPSFKVHEFVVMPNHFHGIIQIKNESTMSLPDIVHRFKTLTTKRYTDGVKNNNWSRFKKKLWQRNYYEHIIRNEISYHQILEYVQTNPLKWQEDTYYA
ncbi:MAG: transposase [Deltaproteobacteria bacterium]|nr:transposase [Deltaproteobacteria bacterium]